MFTCTGWHKHQMIRKEVRWSELNSQVNACNIAWFTIFMISHIQSIFHEFSWWHCFSFQSQLSVHWFCPLKSVVYGTIIVLTLKLCIISRWCTQPGIQNILLLSIKRSAFEWLINTLIKQSLLSTDLIWFSMVQYN